MSYKLHSATTPQNSQGSLDKQNSNLSVSFNDAHKQIKRTLQTYIILSYHVAGNSSCLFDSFNDYNATSSVFCKLSLVFNVSAGTIGTNM